VRVLSRLRWAEFHIKPLVGRKLGLAIVHDERGVDITFVADLIVVDLEHVHGVAVRQWTVSPSRRFGTA